MSFEKADKAVKEVMSDIKPIYKPCKTCGMEWSKLTPTGECPTCNPDYLSPPKLVKKEEERTYKGKESEHEVVCDNPPNKTKGCLICQNTGHIEMVDYKGGVFAFACSCERGEVLARGLRMHPWNGQEWQKHRGKNLKIHEYYNYYIKKQEKPTPLTKNYETDAIEPLESGNTVNPGYFQD